MFKAGRVLFLLFPILILHRYILDARELPILAMFERIKEQWMTRHYTKQIEGEKMQDTICPKIKKKLEEIKEWANTAYVHGSGDKLFQVGDKGVEYIVDLKTKTCTWCRWQKSGIPCLHVLAVCREEQTEPETLVDPCYSVEMFKKAYSNCVIPCKDKSEWQRMNGPQIEPPSYEKHVGRPCKSRRKSADEIICGNGGKKVSRHGIIIHCNYCGEADHNIKGCKYRKARLPPPNSEEPVITAEQSQEPVITQEHNPASAPERVEDMMVDQMVNQVILLLHSRLCNLCCYYATVLTNCNVTLM